MSDKFKSWSSLKARPRIWICFGSRRIALMILKQWDNRENHGLGRITEWCLGGTIWKEREGKGPYSRHSHGVQRGEDLHFYCSGIELKETVQRIPGYKGEDSGRRVEVYEPGCLTLNCTLSMQHINFVNTLNNYAITIQNQVQICLFL